MSAPAWVAQYVGIPFVEHGRTPASGFDCWGAARWIWEHHFDIRVPSYTETYLSTGEGEEVAQVLRAELPLTPWRPIPRAEAQPGDGLLFRIKGYPTHVGVFLDGEQFVHADPRAGVVVDRLTTLWWERRLLAVYRYDRPRQA